MKPHQDITTQLDAVIGGNGQPVQPASAEQLGAALDQHVGGPETQYTTGRFTNGGTQYQNMQCRPFNIPGIDGLQLCQDFGDPVKVPAGAAAGAQQLRQRLQGQ